MFKMMASKLCCCRPGLWATAQSFLLLSSHYSKETSQMQVTKLPENNSETSSSSYVQDLEHAFAQEALLLSKPSAKTNSNENSHLTTEESRGFPKQTNIVVFRMSKGERCRTQGRQGDVEQGNRTRVMPL